MNVGESLTNFDDAVSYCDKINGFIFEPTYGKQESTVFDFYGQNNSWLGITDQKDEGKFKYYSNSKQVGYTNWSEEEPNSDGNCVVSINGTWSDKNCTEGKGSFNK